MASDPQIAAERLNARAKGTNLEARGTHFIEVSAERAVTEPLFRSALSQLTGLFHGGVMLSLEDEMATACALAATMPDGNWDAGTFPLQSLSRTTLLVKSWGPISNTMGVGFLSGMSSVSLAFKRRMQDRCSRRF
jgi:hypothetical protein